MDSLKDALLAASSCYGDSSDRDYLIIDSNFRTILVPRNKRVLGVYNDTSVNRVWFRAPRYYGDIDLSVYNFKINYINAQEDGDIYLVDDVTVDGNDIVFSWLVGYTAFLVEGNVIFNVCATLLNETGDAITNEFNTTVHTLPVLKGLEIDEEYIRTHYPSFIDQIEAFKNAAETAASSALESKNAAKTSEIAAESSKNSAATSAEEALNSKTQAAQSAENALNSKTAAEESKTAAIDAKNSAESAAREALESKDAAKSSEGAAKRSETASKESETNASNSAAAAALSEQNALAFKNAAAISETNAKTSETNALNSATSASRSATNAQESAEIASTAASNAGLSADSASDNAIAARSYAEQANSSAISAGLDADSAHRDAETASSKANEASSSATEAKISEGTAKASENAAKLSENNAKTSETNASRSETNSAENATRAEQAAENAEDFVENVVLVQPEQPTEENNRIWIKQGAGNTVQVPTFQELLEVKKSKAGILRDTVSGSVASFVPDATIDNLLGLDVALEPIQDLHGYDSPWPAGGGVNIFDKDAAEVGKWLNVNTGAIESTSTNYALSDYIPVKSGLPYVFTNPNSSRRWFYDTNKNPVELVGTNPYTPPADGFILMTIAVNSVDINTVMFVQGSTLSTTYAPYSNICPISGRDSVTVNANGTTHTITLPETVYGGDIGVVSGSGESTWTKQVINGDEPWAAYNSGYRFNLQPSNGFPFKAYGQANILCDRFSVVGFNSNRYALARVASIYPTVDEFKAALAANPAEICYELYAPTPISTTPIEVSTVEGENNVFSPDGDVTVEYAADLKTYIDNKIAAAVAALS